MKHDIFISIQIKTPGMASRFLPKSATNAKICNEMIKLIPKTDLHCHLDGSMRLSTLIDLAQQQNVALPSYDQEVLREKVFKDHYESLEAYLKPFDYMTKVTRDQESLERVAFEFAEDCYSEGVRYFEMRFGPHLHAIPGKLSVENIIIAVNKGLAKATELFNQSNGIIEGLVPEYKYGIIICCMRYFDENLSPFYKQFCDQNQHLKKKAMYGKASLELAKASVQLRDNLKIPIVAFDIAGCENGFPAGHHAEAFRYVHENHMNRTIHAGEAYGPESIFQAVTSCYAERIGHGLKLFDHGAIPSSSLIDDTKSYVEGLIRSIANRRICIEVCLTSNFQTDPVYREKPHLHPLKKLLKEKIPVCLNTDNRMVSQTTICDEIRLAADLLDLDTRELRKIIRAGFKWSFMPGTYASKMEYIEKILTYYDKIVAEFGAEQD